MSMVLFIEAQTIPEGWEKAVLGCYKYGQDYSTQYDKEGDPPSKDVTLTLHIQSPMAEPRIHRAIPGGIEDLEKYRLEVVEGISNNLIDPENGKWSYTYNKRIIDANGINQLDYIVDSICKDIRTRRSQAILWNVKEDCTKYNDHPPCLQRIWCRVNTYLGTLEMNAHMRSNDAYKASFMNMYAFTDLQRLITERVNQKSGLDLNVGSYIHFVDSFHIYGSYMDEVEQFIKTTQIRKFKDRVYTTSEVKYIIDETYRKYMDK